eukprot:9467252-Pyramimonas_sp.AAC.2
MLWGWWWWWWWWWYVRWAGNYIGDEGATTLAEALKVYSGSLGTLNLQSECPHIACSALHHQTDSRCDDSTYTLGVKSPYPPTPPPT